MPTVSKSSEKPERLYFKTYLKLLENSVGSDIFRNFYVHTPADGDFDALDNGYNACAFYVSAVLMIFKKIGGIHGTVASTKKDLLKSGWVKANNAKPGDVLIWESLAFDREPQEHIGFYAGSGRAISISAIKGVPVMHDQNFGAKNRKIILVLRNNYWD